MKVSTEEWYCRMLEIMREKKLSQVKAAAYLSAQNGNKPSGPAIRNYFIRVRKAKGYSPALPAKPTPSVPPPTPSVPLIDQCLQGETPVIKSRAPLKRSGPRISDLLPGQCHGIDPTEK